MIEVVLDGRPVGDEYPSYFIAEVGHNHQGSVVEAKRLIDVASIAGCNAVKFQKRDNRTLYTKSFYDSPYNSEAAYGPTYGLHREALEFNMDQYRELKEYAAEKDITLFATPFDIPSVDFLMELGVPFFKIASGSIQNPLLLRRAAEMGKPILVSFGGATHRDISRVVQEVERVPLVLMHCTAAYPTKVEDAGLKRITELARTYPWHVIGFSDHEDGITLGSPAYILGARVFEKHITLSHTNKGTDHPFSLEFGGLQKYIINIRRTETANNLPTYPLPAESKPLTKMGYSVYLSHDLPAGAVLRKDDLVIKSPASGLPAWEYDNLIGKTLVVNIKAEEPLSWSDFLSGV